VVGSGELAGGWEEVEVVSVMEEWGGGAPVIVGEEGREGRESEVVGVDKWTGQGR